MVMIHQRHRLTDGQTTCDSKTALCTVVQRAVKAVANFSFTSTMFFVCQYRTGSFAWIENDQIELKHSTEPGT